MSDDTKPSLCTLWDITEGADRRFEILAKIQARCVTQGDCIVWTGPHSGEGRGGGYGRFSFEGKTASVHRVVFSCVFGPIPPRKQVDHKCKNRLCCKAEHLQLTTHKANQKLRDKRNQK